MRTLRAQCGVVAVAGIHHGVIAVDAEQLAADVTEEFLERPGLPGLADPAREQVITGDGRLGLGQA